MTSPSGDEVPVATTDGPTSRRTNRRLVLKNTIYLTASQALTVPLSILVNVIAARYLGADAFGLSYFAFTVCGFGFLIVSWGHDGVLPAVVARDHSQSGLMLGTSLLFRSLLSIPVYIVMAVGCYVAGYGMELQGVLALTAVYLLLTAYGAACKDAIRGLERTDIPAMAHVGQQLINAAFIIPVLMLGGKLLAALTAQIAACAAILIILLFALRPAGVGRLSATAPAAKSIGYAGAT